MAKLTMQMTKDELCPFIEAQGKELKRMIHNARMKFGNRYNDRNQYQLMIDKFGNPEKNPEKYYDEYRLILQKKSKLPASVRYTVDEFMTAVCQNYIQTYNEQAKETEGVKGVPVANTTETN